MLYTFCTLSAVLWLCYRLYKFLSIPVGKIVQTLKIKTPPATKVSIDRVSVDSITIHWENEPVRGGTSKNSNSISHYLLYLDNSQLAIFPNSPNSLYTCCSLTGLSPETEYQLDFITVNRMGFMNKLPSLYCMTKSNSSRQRIKRSGQWRKNTLTTRANFDSSSSINVSEAAAASTAGNKSNGGPSFALPAYSSLTALKDLESYSIDDLKKILICAQEDLHDVLSQQSSLLQDFQESKLQLELELENLRAHWSHEIDLRKSLKSTIKSLENSKLLYDLKLEKLKKNIDQSKAKIAKMDRDMKNWSHEEMGQLNNEAFRQEYTRAMDQVREEITKLKKGIETTHADIAAQEEANKKLNTLKKTSSSTANLDLGVSQDPSSSSLALTPSDSPNGSQENIPLQSLLKRVNECSVEMTGQLTPAGEEMLSRLTGNPKAVQLIREQLRLDQELENKWKTLRNRMVKRLETLESMFTDISLNNRQLRANLMVQPYAQKNVDSRNSNSNANSSVTLGEQSPVLGSPPMGHLNLQHTTDDNHFNASMTPNLASQAPTNPQLVLHNPSTYVNEGQTTSGRGVTVSPVTVPVNATASTTRPSLAHPSALQGTLLSPQISGSRAYADPSILMNSQPAGQPFPWVSDSHGNVHMGQQPQQRHQQLQHPQHSQQHQQHQQHEQHQQQQTELDQPFEYDNASHLISGLQDMIYDEAEYPDRISDYSKGFTTDQLDNYWTTQKDVALESSKFAQSKSKRNATVETTPLMSYGASLRPPSPRFVGDESLTGFKEALPLRQSDSFHSTNSNLGGLMSHPDDSLRMPNVGVNQHRPQGRFQTPRFNFIWHGGTHTTASPDHLTDQLHLTAPPPHKVEDTHTHHSRSGSGGNIASTWSKFNWKNRSPQAAHAKESAIDDSSYEPPHSPQLTAGGESPSASSGGRRVSRLLSRSGILKLPSYEEKC